MAKKPQTKFTLDDGERAYLVWLARTVFLVDSGNEAAKILVRQGIALRRQHHKEEPSLQDIMALSNDVAETAATEDDAEEAS